MAIKLDGSTEVRDREKIIRGLKKKDTPILTGYPIFHNYIRPHPKYVASKLKERTSG